MVKALVTGATGFVGAQVVRALLAAGHEVTALHRTTSRLDLLDGLEVRRAIGDLLDRASLEKAAAGQRWIFHVAAASDYWRKSPETVYRVNVQGTRTLLRAAESANAARVIVTSSCGAIGPVEGRPATESDPFLLKPRDFPYGHSKALAEVEVRKAVERGLDCVIVNPAVVTGPGDLYRGFGDLAIRIARGQVPVYPPGGVSIIDVRDVAAAHVAAAERGRTGERYILSHLNMPYRDIMAALARAAGKNPPRIGIPGWLMRIAARLVDVGRALRLPIPATGNQLRLSARDLYYDGGKAARALHAPEIGAETLADTVKWYVERGMIG